METEMVKTAVQQLVGDNANVASDLVGQLVGDNANVASDLVGQLVGNQSLSGVIDIMNGGDNSGFLLMLGGFFNTIVGKLLPVNTKLFTILLEILKTRTINAEILTQLWGEILNIITFYVGIILLRKK